MEERVKRQAEMDQRRQERAAEKLDEQPYVSEITLIEQTMLFCKSLTQSKDTDEKKEDREDEYFFAPTKGKKAKGKAKTATKSEGGSKPIKHNAETFRLFDQLKLDAPITTADIPALLEKLDEQLIMYQGKVKKWEEKREEMKRKILEEGVMPEDEDEKKGAEKEKEEETRTRRRARRRRRRR